MRIYGNTVGTRIEFGSKKFKRIISFKWSGFVFLSGLRKKQKRKITTKNLTSEGTDTKKRPQGNAIDV